MDPLPFIRFDGFFSIWYWLITSVVWSATCHWTIGVPYDAIVRADRDPERFAEDVDLLATVNARRVAYLMSGGGFVITGGAFFVLAVLATFSFGYDYELAHALFMLMAPLFFVTALNIRLGLHVEKAKPRGQTLRKMLVRRRFWNQVIGLSAIVFAVLSAFYTIAKQTVLWY